MDILALIDKNGNLSSRKITKDIVDEAISKTLWLQNSSTSSERIWNIYNNKTEYSTCKCGSEIKSFKSWKLGYSIFCSVRCTGKFSTKHTLSESEKLRRESIKIEKRGTAEFRRRQTRERTNIERYGVPYPWMDKETKDERTKNRTITFAKIWIEELKASNHEPLFSPEEYTSNRIRYKVQCLDCSTKYELHRLHWTTDHKMTCPTCYTKNASKPQHEINDFIKGLGFNTRLNDRKEFKGKLEIDIFVKEKNLAIEFDGMYWHSEKADKNVKEKSLHKFISFKDHGLKTLYIFEDEWNDDEEAVKLKIKYALGINDYSNVDSGTQQSMQDYIVIEGIDTSETLNLLVQNIRAKNPSSKIVLRHNNRNFDFNSNLEILSKDPQGFFYVNTSGKRFKVFKPNLSKVWDLGYTNYIIPINR